MSDFAYEPAAKPTFYFIGMTTARSSIMRVFPAWAEYLELSASIRGIDCKQHDDPEVYRRIVSFIKEDRQSLGALITTHKIDLLKAARELFDDLGHYALRLGEVSCISKRDGRLWGHALDPITSGFAMEAFVPRDHWKKTGGELCIFGAGGSSLALTTYIMEKRDADSRPAHIVVTNRSTPRLEEMRRIHEAINPGIVMDYVHASKPENNDAVMGILRPGSVVVNATGLGKDAPGSPITNSAPWPEGGMAWEFNYRGDLVFLDQARNQQREKHLRIEDGWVYFVHGWIRAIAEVFHIDIPTTGTAFDEISRIASAQRR
jgi:shikimate 5-dehydrogenase